MSSTRAKTGDTLSKLRIERPSGGRSPSRIGRLGGMFAVFVLLLALAAVGFVWAQKSGMISGEQGWLSVPDAIKSRTEVRVASVTVQYGRSADATVVATGYIESRRQAKIGARAPGRIEILHVEEGTRVTDGQMLAVLEHADLEASLDATRAMLEKSRAELSEQEVEIERSKRAYERFADLQPSDGIPEADYDRAKYEHHSAVARLASMKAAVSLAEARVREAEQLRENMFIRASFDGTVISKDAEVGESILPGGMGEASGRGSVVTIADLEHLEVECDVKEDYIGRVSSGQSAEVAVDAVPDRRYQGQVRKIIPMGDRARATIKVKVEILDADGRLFPEMSATVYFLPDETSDLEAEQARMFCPVDAVVRENDESFVFVVEENDRVGRQTIEVGPDRDGRIEVLAGLSGNQRVVVSPPAELKSGDLVKAVE